MGVPKKQEHHQILISTDGHCGANLWDYKPYLEGRYHDEFDTWAHDFKDIWAELEDRAPARARPGVASGDHPLNWDSRLRLEHLDGQGIAAEVFFPNTSPPFYPSGALTAPGPRSPKEYEMRWAGLRAHNRWLADFCNDAPDRRAGFAQIFLDDLDDAITEVRWAKDADLKGVLLPGDHVLRLTNLYYPEYDPLWAVCEELEFPVHRHAIFPTESVNEGGKASVLIGLAELEFYAFRGIAHMLIAGVFERYPRLKLVTTELINSVKIPSYLSQLDELIQQRSAATSQALHEQLKDALAELKRLPSEYFATNCYIAGPIADLRQAYEAGTPNLMWGADIPHDEGTSPYSIESVRLQLWDLPEGELQTLLATRPAEVYEFDLGRLQTVADRIGPTLGEIKTPLPLDKLSDDVAARPFASWAVSAEKAAVLQKA